MTDREKLIELIGKTKQEFDKWCLDCEKDKTTTQSFEEFLAGKIFSDGWIRPPCKVGDKVYYIFEAEIRELTVISLSYLFSTSLKHFNLHTTNYRGAVLSYEIKDIGKTVFLTKEEAEKKLKELDK